MKTPMLHPKTLRGLAGFVILASLGTAHADPQLTSWYTANSGKYARIYTSKEAALAGTPVSTWTGQTLPAYSDVQEVSSSTDWVYLRTSGLASHNLGPWYFDTAKTVLFNNRPRNQHVLERIPRAPEPATTKTVNYLGSLGRWVNGVGFFNMLDGAFYNNGAEAQDGGQGVRTAYWIRNAMAVEIVTFDNSNGHQPPSGDYHYHADPKALRYQLGDNVTFTPSTGSDNAGVYTEDTSNLKHSPILGWSYDGYPVYGPYGYSDPAVGSGSTAIRRITSGFVPRNGNFGTDNIAATGRNSLAKWSAEMRGLTTSGSTYPITDTTKRGPAVNSTYVTGYWVEDFAFLGDLGYTQGSDFDLDVYNGRFCRTPEFPDGTYAYFTTIDASNQPAYPYAIGRQWYGKATGGAVSEITETVTEQFIGGPNSALTVPPPSVTGGVVTLTWSSVEGGTYAVDASPDAAAWTGEATGIVATGTSAATAYTALTSNAAEYARVRRTALAAYDTTGLTPATVAQSTLQIYNTTPFAPVISSSLSLTGSQGLAFSYTITATNSPTSYNASGLPAGLAIDTATGVISGMPTAAGSSNITLSATNTQATAMAMLTLNVESTAPKVTTRKATAVAGTAATLNGTVNPNGLATMVHFEYGLTQAYGTVTTDQSAGAGVGTMSAQAVLSGLVQDKTYHFRTVATNSSGTTYGADRVTREARVDVNGDGKTDIVFQNDAGQIAAWFLDGSGGAVDYTTESGFVPGSKYLYSAGLGGLEGWRVVAIRDVNNDGIADFILQYGGGHIATWLLDGSGNAVDFSTGSGLTPGSKYLYPAGLGDWKVVAAADVNDDGIPDLIFQNSIGQIAVWFLDGSGDEVNFSTGSGLKPGSKMLYSRPLGSWRVIAASDVNNDGIQDLIFQDTAGKLAVWFLDGSGNEVTIQQGIGLSVPSVTLYSDPLGDWKAVATGDLNNDGIPDLIFQNASGQIAAWYLDGSGNAVNFSTGSGLAPGSKVLSSGALGDWKVAHPLTPANFGLPGGPQGGPPPQGQQGPPPNGGG